MVGINGFGRGFPLVSPVSSVDEVQDEGDIVDASKRHAGHNTEIAQRSQQAHEFLNAMDRAKGGDQATELSNPIPEAKVETVAKEQARRLADARLERLEFQIRFGLTDPKP